MKKIYLLLAFLVGTSYAKAQCAPDTSYSTPGFYTNDGDSVLEDAQLNAAYSENVSLYVPSTYEIGGFNVNVDSVKIEGITGLPDGIGSGCNPPSCLWGGGDTGCVLISGSPTNSAQLGSNPLTIAMRYYGLGLSKGENVTIFSIEVIDTTQTNTAVALRNPDLGLDIYPNPANKTLNLASNLAEITKIKISDITGKIVNSLVLRPNEKNQLSTETLPSGFYFVQFNSQGENRTERLIIRHQ